MVSFSFFFFCHFYFDVIEIFLLYFQFQQYFRNLIMEEKNVIVILLKYLHIVLADGDHQTHVNAVVSTGLIRGRGGFIKKNRTSWTFLARLFKPIPWRVEMIFFISFSFKCTSHIVGWPTSDPTIKLMEAHQIIEIPSIKGVHLNAMQTSVKKIPTVH